MKRIRQLCLHRIEAYGTNDTMRIDSIHGERIPFSQNTHPKQFPEALLALHPSHAFPLNTHFIRRGMENRIDSLFGKKKTVSNAAVAFPRVDAGNGSMLF